MSGWGLVGHMSGLAVVLLSGLRPVGRTAVGWEEEFGIQVVRGLDIDLD